MNKKITLKMLAKELDLSVSTVSKALHDSHEISQETKDKVQAFAKLYHYKPNNIALSLKNQSTKTIGVIIPEIVHEFFSKVIQGIEEVALEKDYKVIVSMSNESYESEVHNIELLNSGAIDGFIIGLSKETLEINNYDHIQECIEYNTPVVLFDRIVDELNTDKISIDDIESGYKATKHLLDFNRNKIAIITTPDFVTVGKKRLEGYLKAMNEAGIKLDENHIIKFNGGKSFSKNLQQLEEILLDFLKKNPDIDSIVTVNESDAVAVLRAARQLQIEVPSQLSVVTFSDGLISKSTFPSLTTISQHGVEMGKQAANILIESIVNTSPVKKVKAVEIPTELIIRESTSFKSR
jgi:LacI family transcriptional regulator